MFKYYMWIIYESAIYELEHIYIISYIQYITIFIGLPNDTFRDGPP